MYGRMYLCMNVYVHTYGSRDMIYTDRLCIYIHVCMYVYIYMCVHKYVLMCLSMYMNILYSHIHRTGPL